MSEGGYTLRPRFEPGTTVADLRAYMAPFVATLGYKFNTDEEFVQLVLDSEIEVLGRDGDVFCPCRVRTGVYAEDVRIVCPCIPFYLDDFSAMRKCWCGLFIRTDVEDGSELHGVIQRPPGPVEVRVAAEDELRVGEAKRVTIGKRRVALFHTESGWHAMSDVCRHWGGPMSEGPVQGEFAVCPWHGWRYDVRTGTTDHPNADVKVYPVTVRDGEVFVTA